MKKVDVVIDPYKNCSLPYGSYYGGKRHSGFAQESHRIAYKIKNKLDDYDLDTITQIVFTGHSLGGAVAALVEPNFRNINNIATRLCVFGTPRFTDLVGCARCYSEPYTHVRRKRDKIPTTPPRKLGYADHPIEVGTDGNEYQDIKNSNTIINGKREWDGFLLTTRKHHKMDKYRNELALTIGSRYVNTRLCDYPEVKKRDARSSENEE